MFITEIEIYFVEKSKADNFFELYSNWKKENTDLKTIAKKGKITLSPKGEILSFSQQGAEIFIDQIDDKKPEIELWEKILNQYFPGKFKIIYHSVDEDNGEAFSNDIRYQNKYFVSADTGMEPRVWWLVSKSGIKTCLKKFDFPIESKYIGKLGLNQAQENFIKMYPEGNLKIIPWEVFIKD